MGKSTFTGPLVSGNIINTSGSTLGRNVKNTGTAVLVQEVPVTQVAAAIPTNIVLPAHSTIISINLFVTVPWDGAATTVGVGTTGAANELAIAADNDAAAIGILKFNPGASAARVGKWGDTGATDVRINLKSTNVGAGVGRLVVVYGQNVADS